MQNKGNKGFTLVELIVVIAIIAILAAVSIVGYNQFIQQARNSRAETELDVIIRQVESEYYVDGKNFYFHGSAWSEVASAPTATAGDLYVEMTFNPNSGLITFSDFDYSSAQAWGAVVDANFPGVVTPAIMQNLVIAFINAALDDEETLLTTSDLTVVATASPDNPPALQTWGYTITLTYTVEQGTAKWEELTSALSIATGIAGAA